MKFKLVCTSILVSDYLYLRIFSFFAYSSEPWSQDTYLCIFMQALPCCEATWDTRAFLSIFWTLFTRSFNFCTGFWEIVCFDGTWTYGELIWSLETKLLQFFSFIFFLSLLGEHSSREDIKHMLSLKDQCARYWIWHSKACNDTDHKDVALLKT